MTRIVENDGTVIVGFVLWKKQSPVPHLRIRRFEIIEESMNLLNNNKGSKHSRIGFCTEIIPLDDIRSMSVV